MTTTTTHAPPARHVLAAGDLPAAPTHRRQLLLADVAFVALLGATGAMVWAGTEPAVRLPFVLLAMLVCPGYAMVRLSGLKLGADALALTIAGSLATSVVVSTIQARAGWWNPRDTALAVGIAAVCVLVVARVVVRDPRTTLRPALGVESPTLPVTAQRPLRRRRPSGRMTLALTLASLGALGLWIFSARAIDITGLGTWGLVPAFPIIWYLGLAVTAFGCLFTQLLHGRTRVALSLLFLGLLVLYLFGTAPAIEATPRYAWVYKHIGVIRYILVNHGVHNVDIYQRWPGLFSVGAIFSTLSGRLDPVSYVAWGEPFFTVLDLVMLFPLARRFAGSRGAWMACFFFVATNWIGEQYFSPQALAYVLTVATILLATGMLDGRITPWADRFVGGRLGVPARAPVRVGAAALSRDSIRFQWWYAIPMLVLLDAAIVVTHQLTPYILLIVFILFAVSGLLRPAWLVLALVAVTVGYLLPNLGYIQNNFGLFSSLDPFNNATAALGGAHPINALRHIGWIATALTGLTWVVGVAGMAVEWRHRPSRRAVLVVAIIFVAPFLSLFTQSYGGEARLRIVLFSLPACAIGAAWLWRRCRGHVARSTVALLLVPLPAALFVVSAYGLEDLSYVPPGEVAAANWLYDHARENQVLVLADTEFPGLIGANYPAFPSPTGDFSTDLVHTPQFPATRNYTTTPTTIEDITAAMLGLSRHSYLILSTTEANYARDYQALGGLEEYRDLQNEVARSPNFRLVYGNSDAAIYQLR